MSALVTTVSSAGSFDLAAVDSSDTAGLDKDTTKPRFEALARELGELQELLFAASTHSLLIILQGMDTSGKDGAVRNVLRDVNPVGTRVVSFKAPTPDELSHDFLWRIHQQTPVLGKLVVFNRSHYEDVTVVRVKGLVPESVWRSRYDHINDFERLLVESNTIVLKFFLHISKEEQAERLLAREREVEKAWKLAIGDWMERQSWDAYMEAYSEAIGRCANEWAPWHIVPANKKWFRNLAVAETVVEALRPLREGWIASLQEQGTRELSAIQQARAAGTIDKPTDL